MAKATTAKQKPAALKTQDDLPKPASVPELTPAESGEAPDTKLVLRKKTFVERVMIEGGLKKGEARGAMDAVLKVLGEALSEGEEMQIPPLGKLKVNRQFEKNGDEILVVKLRRPSGMLADVAADEKTDTSPLAEDED